MRKRNQKESRDFGAPIYSEKLSWPAWLWAFVIFLFSSLSLALWAAAGTRSAFILSALELLFLLSMKRKSSLHIFVTKGWLVVGKAAIPRAHIYNFRALSPATMKSERGPGFDPAAYIDIRFWVKGGVKIAQRDPKDPTPYWLISSRAPENLVRVLDLQSMADH